MAVKIRMTRMGNNKKPFFRIVVAEVKRKINGQYLEIVGWYDPKKKNDNFELKLDRVEYWLGTGAEAILDEGGQPLAGGVGGVVPPGTGRAACLFSLHPPTP